MKRIELPLPSKPVMPAVQALVRKKWPQSTQNCGHPQLARKGRYSS